MTEKMRELNGKKILILASNGFEQCELEVPETFVSYAALVTSTRMFL